jgi:hypothetical protein
LFKPFILYQRIFLTGLRENRSAYAEHMHGQYK